MVVGLADAAADCSGYSDEAGAEEHEAAWLGGREGGGDGEVAVIGEAESCLGDVVVGVEDLNIVCAGAVGVDGAGKCCITVDAAQVFDEIAVDVDKGCVICADVEGDSVALVG